MAESILTEVRLFATFFYYYVVSCILTLRNQFARDVWNFEQLVGHIVLSLLHYLFQSLGISLEHSYLGLGAFSFFLLAFLHKGTNLLGKLVSLLLVVIQLLLSFTTNLVVLQYFLYGLTSIWKMLLFKTFNYTFSFFTDEFKCKHIMSFNLIIYNLKAKVQKIFVITQKNADFFTGKGRIKVFLWFYRVKELRKGDGVIRVIRA